MKTTEQLSLEGAFLAADRGNKTRSHPRNRRTERTTSARRPGIQPRMRRDEEGVSPVIGIILMVAITVALAATVFLAVGGLDEGASPTPQVSFQSERGGPGGSIMVLQVGTLPIAVSDLTVNPSNCILRDAGGNPKTTGNLGAADYFECPDDGSVVIVDNGSGAVIFSGTV